MLEHLYSPQMSDIFIRLLNFSESVFTKSKDSVTSLKSSEEEVTAVSGENNVMEN